LAIVALPTLTCSAFAWPKKPYAPKVMENGRLVTRGDRLHVAQRAYGPCVGADPDQQEQGNDRCFHRCAGK
jgi:hypothetical protein